MDVLMLSGDLGSGGASRVIHQIVSHFPREINTTVAYLGGDSYLVDDFERMSVPVIRLADHPFSPRGVWRLYNVLREHSPDIIHTHMMVAGLFGRPLGALQNIPVIHTVHTNYRMRPAAAKCLDVLTAPFDQQAVCVSNSVQRSLPFYYFSNISVIHNCIDIEQVLGEGTSEWEELDWTSDLSQDAPVIANVARYDPKKRRRDIIEGFDRVVTQYPDAQLVLTGSEDKYQRELEKFARRRGLSKNIFFVGFIENPQTVYHHADTIIFASESEGFSIGLLEAMAHSRPIIATDIPAFVEALGEDYPGLFPVRSPQQLGDKIIQVLDDDRLQNDMCEKVSQKIECFSGSVAADEYVELYRKYG